MFCLSESDTFYLYPYPTDNRTEQDRTERDRGTGPCPEEQQGAAYIRTVPCPYVLCPLYGAHHVITSGGQRSILRIR